MLFKLFKKAAQKQPADKIIVYSDRIEWMRNGKLHRDKGPAIVWFDGTREWWRNGKRHREDGPAIERNCGCTAWYMDDILCKTEGPNGTRVFTRKGPNC